MSNEIGRLVQCNDTGIISTDCMEFIHKYGIPEERKVTYAIFACDYRPLKLKSFHIRPVLGGDKLDHHDDTESSAASMMETKLLVNSVTSDAQQGARFMSYDL